MMLDVSLGRHTTCDGVTRRSVLRAGGLALLGVGARGSEAGGRARAVIQVVLGGGPSHLETYDPKPDAPAEFRGEIGAIATALPGVAVSALFPRQARVLDKVAIVRGLHHATSDHAGGMHWVMTGYPSADATPRGNERPSVGSLVARVLGPRRPGLPAYVGVPRPPSLGQAAYLGPAFNPFSIEAEPAGEVAVRNLEPPEGLTLERLDDRRDLLRRLDRIERRRDASGMMEGLDRFAAEAYAMVTGPSARRAFDLAREGPRTRDRYGRTPIGQGCLLARRLVEAGVTFVTVSDGGWDHHSGVSAQCRRQLPPLDAAIASLVEDLHQSGLDRDVLVLVWGEFGRTPRINGAGGRDHWPGCMSALVAGGGLSVGQVVGGSSPRGEHPAGRALRPEDLIRTVYQTLGIDPAREFPSDAGRPMAILNHGRPIDELL